MKKIIIILIFLFILISTGVLYSTLTPPDEVGTKATGSYINMDQNTDPRGILIYQLTEETIG